MASVLSVQWNWKVMSFAFCDEKNIIVILSVLRDVAFHSELTLYAYI